MWLDGFILSLIELTVMRKEEHQPGDEDQENEKKDIVLDYVV